MTAVLIVSVYLFALAGFLGLDVVAKVPPTLAAGVLVALGGLCGLAGLPALQGDLGAGGVARWVALAAASAAVVGALVALAGLARRKDRPRHDVGARGDQTT